MKIHENIYIYIHIHKYIIVFINRYILWKLTVKINDNRIINFGHW